MKKVIISLIFAAVVCLTVFAASLTAYADGLTWTLEDGVLTISGTGDMDNYRGRHGDRPWNGRLDEINKVVIGDGVTRVGSDAFADAPALVSVELGKSVKSIGFDAFAYCDSLESISFSAPIVTIEQGTVYGAENLRYVTLTGQTKEEFLAIASAKPYNDNYANAEFSFTFDPDEYFVYEDGKYYYEENGVRKTGWFEIDGANFYALLSDQSVVMTDKKIGGKFYFWNNVTGLTLANGFYNTDKGTICYENGYQVYGWRHADGSSVVYDEVNNVSEQYSSDPQGLYYFSYANDWLMVKSDTCVIAGYTREFRSDHTVKPINGFQNVYQILYYYVNGERQTGWMTDKSTGLTYYFTRSDARYGEGATKWISIGGLLYYFRATTSNDPYSLVTSGKIGGVDYEFSARDGHILADGFINYEYANLNNNNTPAFIQKHTPTARYYIDGIMQYGWQLIDGD